ncbi:Sec-independent protein translocase TatB [Microbacterium sp. SL62]|uniref:Sec-independent protein translocase subunit TatA/TatB n=1 Tax=Microbacterium sp. SL62 TaxID=2995139 RepID=UPI00227326E6|nr:Sec-independent protein translocase TatB [Microbacterium sp. SL62]MCY1717042.1 Sec-independent protein translocase TatB [Microbacterium sp. SL62]
MFGLTLEKLLLVGLIAAVVIGPQRLPGVVARLASLVRALRATVDAARHRAATELGVPADASEWRALDPRRYDPRRIIAEALAAPPVAMAADTASVPVSTTTSAPDAADATAPVVPERPSVPMRRVRVGSSAHPRWIEVPAGSEVAAPDAPAAPAEEATARATVSA